MTLAERATKLGLMGASLYEIFDRVEQLETQLAEEAEAHAVAMNAAYAEIERLRYVIEEAADIVDITIGAPEEAREIREMLTQFDEARMDIIGQNGNDGLAYQEHQP